MKNILLISFLFIISSLFIGCGSSGGGESSDVILKKGDSITCTKASSFSVKPTDDPKVSFLKDVESGEVTVTMNRETKGFVTIINCSKK